MGWEEEERRDAAEIRARARREIDQLRPGHPRMPTSIHRPRGLDLARARPGLYHRAHDYVVSGAAVRRGARQTGPSGERREGFTTDLAHSASDLLRTIRGQEAIHLSPQEQAIQREILILTAMIAASLLEAHVVIASVRAVSIAGRLTSAGGRLVAGLARRFGTEATQQTVRLLIRAYTIYRRRGLYGRIARRFLSLTLAYLFGDIEDSVKDQIVRLVREFGGDIPATILREFFDRVSGVQDAFDPLRTQIEDRGLNFSEEAVEAFVSGARSAIEEELRRQGDTV
jgi:hypothetical protein